MPGGATIRLRNLETGVSQTAPMLNGGLDPVAIVARTGDTLEFVVTDTAGRTQGPVTAGVTVHPPLIVRTSPPSGGTDVAVNAEIVVVFSEPMNAAQVNTQTVQLLWHGEAVSGTVALSADGLRAVFIPSSPLAPSSTYTLVVSAGVADLSGAHLPAALTITFQTGAAGYSGPSVSLVPVPAVSAGYQHTCAVTANGDAYCWGANFSGELGTGAPGAYIATPVLVSGGLRFASVGAGYEFTCGLTTTGAAFCWGNDWAGELGIGSANTDSGRSVPTPVFGGFVFTSLSVGPDHVCGTTSDGRAACWGNGSTGQLGDPSFQWNEVSLVPLVVDETSGFEKGRPASIGATGLLHTCGLDSSGHAYCWGTLHYNVAPLGSDVGVSFTTGSPTPLSVPPGVVLTSVATGLFHSCAIAFDGAAFCWGENSIGQLGTGSFSVPTFDTTNTQAYPQPVVGGVKFVQIASGQGEFTCGVAVGGGAYCWGVNDDGQLGSPPDFARCPIAQLSDSLVNYAAVSPGEPIPCSTTPVRAADPLTFASVSTGTTHTCGLGLDGQVYCWGGNRYGQLGNGSISQSSVPVLVNIPVRAASVPQASRVATGVAPMLPSAKRGHVCNVRCRHQAR